MGIEVVHHWVDQVANDGTIARSGKLDARLPDMTRFVVYRVRFQVANTSEASVTFTPTLEARPGAAPDAWDIVPAADPVPGSPFYVASDDGLVFRVRADAIATDKLRRGKGPGDGYETAAGMTSSGMNPAPDVTLPARSVTEVEFAIRASVAAAWSETYALRLRPVAETADPGVPLVVILRKKPLIRLTLPMSTTRDGPTAGLGLQYALVAPAASDGPRYRLASTARLAATVEPTSPHITSSLEDDGCAACHSAHRATNQPLITNVYRVDPLRAATEPYDAADFTMCIRCHEEAPFADTSGSANPLTEFPGHGYHLGLIEEDGTGGLDINTPGDGQGNALCAECHYNLHGLPSSERGLVIFAPDVEPYSGQLVYDAATQSCTLTCHGRAHDGLTFAVPSPGI